MEALVCAFSELHIREDSVSWAQGLPGHPDTPSNIYEGGLGAQQQQCPSAQGSKPKNFRLRHLRGLALYLPGHMQPAGQCESHWLGRLMAGGCLPWPEGMAWPLDLPQGTLNPGNSHRSALLEAQLPRNSLGNTGSSSSMDPAKGAPPSLVPMKAWGSGPRDPGRPQRSPPVHCARESALGLWRGRGDPSAVFTAQDRRGKMTQEEAEEAGPERKGSAPPLAPPDGDTCRCPAPEPGPTLGKLEGRKRRS